MTKYVAQIGEGRKFQSALDLAGGLIGSVRGGPADLATNAKYMDDYGKRRRCFNMSLGFVTCPFAQILLASNSSQAGLQVGPYRLVRELDGGGMGVVYLAVRSDEHYFQIVAVKMLRSGLASPALVQRFRTERQILASLSHPNIGAILDGGDTQDGRPFIVMEYVEGQPITQASKAAGLSIRQRIELFCSVCSAVHYAHQKSVIHRDIKPNNVLVTPEGVVKLIDFGISKPLDPELIPGDLPATETFQRLMTPDYASPEQILGRKLAATTDVYSLGVLLFELLTESRPYSLRELSPAAAERVVCEREVPKPSSVRALSAHTRRELKGDLDRVVSMAMDKDPSKRYSSAQNFEEDLRRYLEGKPVLARKATLTYTLSKFVKRHRTAALMTCAIVVVLIGATLVYFWQSHLAERRVQQAAALADSAISDMAEKLQHSAASVEVQASLFRSALEHLDQLRRSAGNDPRLLLQISKAYERVGDLEGSPFVANLGKLGTAATSYREALRMAMEAHDRLPGGESAAAIVEIYQRLGDLDSYLGHPQQASEDYQRGLAWARDFWPQGSASPLRNGLLSGIHAGLGKVHIDNLEPDKALDSVRAALQVIGSDTNGNADHDHKIFRLYWLLSQALSDSRPPSEAVAALRKSVAIAESVAQSSPSPEQAQRDLFVAYYYIGGPLAGDEIMNVGNANAAQEYARKALVIAQQMATRDTQNAQARDDLGFAYEAMGGALHATQPQVAGGFYRDAIAIARQKALQSGEGRRAQSLLAAREDELAAVLVARKEAPERLQLLEEANDLWKQLLGSGEGEPRDRLYLMSSYCRLSDAELALNDLVKAQQQAESALPFFNEFQVGSPSLRVLREVGFCYERLGNVQWSIARNHSFSTAARRDAQAAAHQWYLKSLDAWTEWIRRGVATADSEVERLKVARLLQATT